MFENKNYKSIIENILKDENSGWNGITLKEVWQRDTNRFNRKNYDYSCFLENIHQMRDKGLIQVTTFEDVQYIWILEKAWKYIKNTNLIKENFLSMEKMLKVYDTWNDFFMLKKKAEIATENNCIFPEELEAIMKNCYQAAWVNELVYKKASNMEEIALASFGLLRIYVRNGLCVLVPEKELFDLACIQYSWGDKEGVPDIIEKIFNNEESVFEHRMQEFCVSKKDTDIYKFKKALNTDVIYEESADFLMHGKEILEKDFFIPKTKEDFFNQYKQMLCVTMGMNPEDVVITDIRDEKVEENQNEENKLGIEEFLEAYTPKKIVEYLDEYVCGQKEAKKTCAMALYKQVMNCKNEVEDVRNNLLIAGPTGCGKTEIWRTLSKISPLPIIIHDVSRTTGAIWKGEDVTMPVKKLLATGYSEKVLKYGIIVLDEFDKICAKTTSSYGENFNYETQGQMLAMVEGTNVQTKTGNFNTNRLCFVFLGAFEQCYQKEKITEKQIGFILEEKESKNTNNISMDDIIKFGLRLEMAGRIGKMTEIEQLTSKDYEYILNGLPQNMINKYKEQVKALNIKLNITENAVKKIAENAYKKKLGVRGLNSLIDQVLDGETFALIEGKKDKELLIDEKTLEKYL